MNYILETNHLAKKHGTAYRVKDVNREFDTQKSGKP